MPKEARKIFEAYSCHITEYSWNIFMPCGFAYCDVTKYSLMRFKIFYHMDKGLA
jgi:hypothetical protein